MLAKPAPPAEATLLLTTGATFLEAEDVLRVGSTVYFAALELRIGREDVSRR